MKTIAIADITTVAGFVPEIFSKIAMKFFYFSEKSLNLKKI
jgi:hypothetical protein